MSHVNPGFISTYNSLTDKHLAGYFSNIRIRRHLQRAGLITRSGRIVPDKEYRHKLIQRTHQRHVRECLAQAIFHKVLEMEHDHQIEIKRRLEEFARRERMHKIKVERSKRYEDDIIRILSPRPPTGARGLQKQHSGPEGEHSESSESPGSSRPNTAPGKMQRPVRLKPLHSNGTAASLRHSSPYRLLESSNENGQSVNSNMESQRRLTRLEAPHGISPYCLPVINNFVTPVPPATKRQEGGLKVTPGSILRGRRLRPATSSSGADVNEDPPMLRSSVYQSKVSVNMMYLGKTVHLSHDLYDRRDEVKVFQQHCGGENLCVYKGMLHEGETFRFISRRHRGFPFSLTFFLNGLQVERVSSCCEFKHRKGSRIGGRHGHFGFSSTDGASPCYKCIIAMGLDKKPTPPPKRVKEGGGRVESVISPKHVPEVKMERSGKEVASHLESEGSRPQDVETWVKEETAAEENQGRDDYEEDFEGDDEGPVEDVEAKENKYPSLSCESQSQIKERDDSETENDRDEYTKSRSASSSSGSDQDESDAADSEEDKKVETFKEVDQEEAVFQPDEMDKPNQENLPATEAESADVHNSARDSTEEDLSDTSAPSGDKNKQSDCASEDKEVEKTVDESKQDEEQERAKSVQEKLAEAIMKESQCDSEPELSDTSTEEEESSANVAEQDSRDPVQESAVIRTEQQNLLEEKKCGESFNVKAKVVVQDGEQTSNPKEQEPRRNRDGAEDEVVKIDEEDGLAASEGNTADNTISEMTGLHPMCEEEMYEKTSVPQEDPAAKFNDNVKIEEENKEKAAVEADTQPHETEQRTNSGEEDESSVSESNQKTDERAVPNNAEESMMTASERTEMKAEPPEERVALSCEEASVADTQERQQGDREAEIEAENSSSSLEGSGDTTVEKRVESSEDSLKDERNTSDIKEEEVSAVGAGGKDEEETCDLGQEQQKECVEIDDKVGEKSENEDMGEGKHPNPDVLTDAAYREEHKVLDKESDSNTEEKADEQAEKTCSKDEGSAEEDADEETIREKEEGSKCVKNEKRKKEPEEKESEKDQTNEGDKTSVINSAADIEMAQEDHNEDRADQGEGAKNENDEESDETKYVLGEAAGGEGKPEVEKHVAGVLTDDTVKTSDEDFVESEVVGESDAANATHEGIVTEERVNDVMVAEDEREDTERDGENGDIDAENGEIFSRAENKIKDERGSQTGSANLVDKEENMEEEMKMKDVLPDKQKEEKDDQAPDTNVADSEVKEEDDIMEEKDKFTKNNSKPETTDPEIKEESKSHDGHDCEESKQDENGNISACERENTDLIKMSINTQRAVKEVQVASSGDKEESSTPTAGDLDSTASRLEESNRQNDAEIYPETNENFAAADGENGDPEELSKASEETVSVLLQPQIQSPTLKEDSVAVSKETPDALETEDNIDLVKNWVTMHQASKFFETFVEPLDDLKESEAKASTPTESTKLPGLGSPQKVMEMAENVRVKEPFVSGSMEQEQTPKDVGVSKEKTKDTHVESDLESNPSVDNKDSLQAEEKTGLKDFMPEAKSEKNDVRSVKGQDSWPEEPKGSIRSLEEGEVNGSSVQDNPEHVTETEVESLAGTHRSVTSDRPENKTEEEATGPGPDLTAVKEMKDAAPSSERESCRELSPCAEGLSQSDKKEIKEETKENGQDLTVITDFTEEGSQDGSHDNETKPKSSEASISGERRDIRLIEDIQQTLSKGGLRKFSVDETLFGRSSYPLVIAARADSEN